MPQDPNPYPYKIPYLLSVPGQDWLNIEGLAEVEITLEDPAHPIESALLPRSSFRVVCRLARQTDDPTFLQPTATAAADLDEFRGAKN